MADLLPWWLMLEIVGLAAWPLCWRLCAHLGDRGYGLSKAFGLLLVSYILWIGSSFGLLANDLGAILASLLLVGAASWWAMQGVAGGWGALRSWLRAHARLVVVSEGMFLAAFVLWAIFRAFDPAIAGTEKPMEFTFLNGILRSPRFPPLDPWLSGYAISYYYFGYVMLAVLTRLSGVAPAIAFNLGVASWMALTMAGAFSVSYNLLCADGRNGARELLAALLGPLFVALMGNLEGLFEVLHARGWLSAALRQWLDVKDLGAGPATGSWLPTEHWWWWRASRVIHDRDLLGNSIGVQPIDEFPLFSFLLGDMHPHVLALPFALLAIGLGLNLFLCRRSGEGRPVVDGTAAEALAPLSAWGRTVAFLRPLAAAIAAWPLARAGFGLYALALGALGFLNTWDFPIYLLLAAAAYGLRRGIDRGTEEAQAGQPASSASRWAAAAVDAIRVGAGLGALGALLYLPFYLGFSSQAGGILPNLIFPTRLVQFGLMFGLFLAALAAWLAALTSAVGWRRVARAGIGWLPWTLGAPLLVGALAALLVVVTPAGQSFLRSALDQPALREQVAGKSAWQLLSAIALARLRTPGTTLLLALGLAWIAALVQVSSERPSVAAQHPSPARPGRSDPAAPATVYVLLLAAVALLLTLAVEWVYLKDTFGVRMNTVFKFYYQAWVLLALTAAYGVVQIAVRARASLRAAAAPAKAAWLGALSLIVLLSAAGLLYTIPAIYSKANRFQGEATLDGLIHLRRYQPDDMAAIEWLQANVKGVAVVLEAPGGSYSQFNRVSMATGLPTLLGWDGHELQWRGSRYGELVAGRPEAIERIYRSARGQELRDLMDQWQIDYLYVGGLEREKYHLTTPGLARFEQTLFKAYENATVRIYRR